MHGGPAVPVAAGVALLPGQLSIQLSSGRSLSLGSKDYKADSVGELAVHLSVPTMQARVTHVNHLEGAALLGRNGAQQRVCVTVHLPTSLILPPQPATTRATTPHSAMCPPL